jgi:hypothetical protein
VYALRNQVEVRWSSANAGKRLASTFPRSSISVETGNSSKRTTTRFARATPPTVRASASPANATFDTGETTRNRNRKTTGTAVSTFMNDRTGAARA